MNETVFEHELKSFKAHLTQAEQNNFAGTTIKDLHLTIASIQKSQLSDRTNKNIKRLRTFLEAVDSLTKVLDVFVNVNDFVAFVWGPMKFLLLTASTFTDAFATLLSTYESIGRQLPLLAQYQDLFQDNDSMREVLGHMFQSVFEFHLRALRFFQASKWKQIFKAHVFHNNFTDIIDNLRQHKELVDRQASLVEFKEANNARIASQKHHQDTEEHERLRRRLFMRDWLDAPNMAEHQEKGHTTREARPESGRWLLSRDRTKAWLDPAMSVAPCLWVHGIPGAGKTVLASLLVESCQTNAHVKTVYFYCRHGDRRRDNFISMSRSLLDQLSNLESSVVDLLYDMAVNNDTCFKTRKATEDLLQLCLDAVGTVFIVLDGLDECAEPEQKAIARWLRKYVDNSGGTVDPSRCVFLSQDDASTRALLSTLPAVRITTDDNQADIRAYCSAIAKDIQTKFAETDGNTNLIVEAVTSKAKGMFLYATLVMDNLLQQTTLAAMRAELEPKVFPDGLDQAYGRILSRVLDVTRPASRGARRLLAWLVCAFRPLKWYEIQCAVSIDPEAGNVDLDQRFVVGPKDICGSLIEQHSDGSLQLVHTTAKTYLISSNVVSEPMEHLQLSKLCLEQFCLSAFNDSLTTDDLKQYVQAGAFAFFEYSLVNWVNHFLARLQRERNMLALAEPDVDEFVEVLDIFLDVHWLKPKRRARMPSSMMNAVKTLPGLEAGHKAQMLQTVASLNGFASSELQDPIRYETLKLYSILRKVRLSIENLAQHPNTCTDLERFYGCTAFKCPRLYCKWFYEGFPTAAKRDEHVAKHERAYYCSYFGCTHATLGCKTADELEIHHQTYHKLLDTCDDFPPNPVPLGSMTSQPTNPPAPNSSTTNVPAKTASVTNVPATNTSTAGSAVQNDNTLNSKATTLTFTAARATHEPAPKRVRPIGPFTCDACSKIFQKLAHLRSHKRIHTDERPFACNTCGKSFARQPDLTRHRSLHSGDRKHTCGGTLQDGRAWGCGKKFARSDGLARHFKGDVGKLCVKPLSDESLAMGAHNTAVLPNIAATTTSTGGPSVSTAPYAFGHDPFMTGPSNPDNSMMGWRQLPPISQLGLNTTRDPYLVGDDDPYPDSLYQHYPGLAEINWDTLLPEQS